MNRTASIRPLVELVSLTIVLIGLASTGACTKASSPEMTQIEKLETAIESGTPKHGEKLRPLKDYARYYAFYLKDGHRRIEGEFVADPFAAEGAAGVHIVSSRKSFPLIADGGCSVVHVVYDVDTGKLVYFDCNGMG
jgi:hypothetical protein